MRGDRLIAGGKFEESKKKKGPIEAMATGDLRRRTRVPIRKAMHSFHQGSRESSMNKKLRDQPIAERGDHRTSGGGDRRKSSIGEKKTYRKRESFEGNIRSSRAIGEAENASNVPRQGQGKGAQAGKESRTRWSEKNPGSLKSYEEFIFRKRKLETS